MKPLPPFAVVGLGTGTLASYAKKGQVAHIYEIDPAVLHLSEPADGSPPFFFYLQDAKKRGVKSSTSSSATVGLRSRMHRLTFTR